jgi:hypothetical protein
MNNLPVTNHFAISQDHLFVAYCAIVETHEGSGVPHSEFYQEESVTERSKARIEATSPRPSTHSGAFKHAAPMPHIWRGETDKLKPPHDVSKH